MGCKNLYAFLSFLFVLALLPSAQALWEKDAATDTGNITIPLNVGWNLIGVDNSYPSLPAPDSDINMSDIWVAYILNTTNNQYVLVILNGQQVKQQNGQPISLPPGNLAMWIYPTKNGNLKLNMPFANMAEDPLTIDAVSLNPGWNIIAVTPAMVGRSFDDMGVNCQITTVYGWDQVSQAWVSVPTSTVTIPYDVGHSLFVWKAGSGCNLESGSALPPPPILPSGNKSDLTITNLALNNLGTGYVEIEIEVENIGSVGTNPKIDIEYYYGGWGSVATLNKPIPNGGKETITVQEPYDPNAGTLYAFADPYYKEDEEYETNNVLIVTISSGASAQCSNGVIDTDETDLDCGGPTCGATCDLGLNCNANTDCQSGYCDPNSNTCDLQPTSTTAHYDVGIWPDPSNLNQNPQYGRYSGGYVGFLSPSGALDTVALLVHNYGDVDDVNIELQLLDIAGSIFYSDSSRLHLLAGETSYKIFTFYPKAGSIGTIRVEVQPISGLDSYNWDNYFEKTPYYDVYCTDTDFVTGLGFEYKQGLVIDTGNPLTPYIDYCLSGNTIREYSCSNSTGKNMVYNDIQCPTGCNNGACY